MDHVNASALALGLAHLAIGIAHVISSRLNCRDAMRKGCGFNYTNFWGGASVQPKEKRDEPEKRKDVPKPKDEKPQVTEEPLKKKKRRRKPNGDTDGESDQKSE